MRSLERRLDEERASRRRADTIIARLTQANADLAARVPELEAPREAPEASETVEEERAEAQATTQHQQAQRPSEGVEHDAGTLREWSGDVEARRRSDAGEA